MFTDLMLDLETLGTGPQAAITQIGLAAFSKEDPSAGITVQSWHLEVQPQLDRGAVMDWSTIQFWLRQNDAARYALLDGEAQSPLAVLVEVNMFISAFVEPRALHWAQSPSFDHVILRSLYARFGNYSCPFHYRQEADVRTLRLLYPQVPKVVPEIPHHAGHDAKAQALYVQDIYAHINALFNKE